MPEEVMKTQQKQSYSNLFVCAHGLYVLEGRWWNRKKIEKTPASYSQVIATGSACNGSRHYIGLFVFFCFLLKVLQSSDSVESGMGQLKTCWNEWANGNVESERWIAGKFLPKIKNKWFKWESKQKGLIKTILFWFWCVCNIYFKNNARWSALINEWL